MGSGGLAASSHMLLLDTLYELGVCSSSDHSAWSEDGGAVAEEGGSDEGDSRAFAAAAAAWAEWNAAKAKHRSSSSNSSSEPSLSAQDCPAIFKPVLSLLQADEAASVRGVLEPKLAAVHSAAQLAAAVIQQRLSHGLRRAPNVPLGTLAAVALLSVDPALLGAAFLQLGKLPLPSGGIGTRVQVDGPAMQHLVRVCHTATKLFQLQLGGILQDAGSRASSSRLASVLQLLGAVITERLAAAADARCKGDGVRLQVAMLGFGKGVHSLVGGEGSLVPGSCPGRQAGRHRCFVGCI